MTQDTPLWLTIVTNALTILAVAVSPVIAVRVAQRRQEKAERDKQKLWIFKTLMTTRAGTLMTSYEHVQALNLIDLEFADESRASKAVRSAWRSYQDHLNTRDTDLDRWGRRRSELLIELLDALAKALNYEFDSVHLAKAWYVPQGYADLENDEARIRKSVANLLEGKGAINIRPIDPNDPPPSAIEPRPLLPPPA